MSMPVNKRNWRKQGLHIQFMNFNRQFKVASGECTNGGRPSAQKVVYEWRQQHPEGRKADCRRDTGLDPKTIRKWWECPPPPLRFRDGHIAVPVEPSQAVSDFLVAALAADEPG